MLAAIDKDPALKAKPPRCTFQDNLVNVFGVDPKTGLRPQPVDNVGVQYGLKALNDGVITMAQFIDINTRIGGHDVDGKIVAQRQVGDEQAIKAAYVTGRINEMTGGSKAVDPVHRLAHLRRRRPVRPRRPQRRRARRLPQRRSSRRASRSTPGRLANYVSLLTAPARSGDPEQRLPAPATVAAADRLTHHGPVDDGGPRRHVQQDEGARRSRPTGPTDAGRHLLRGKGGVDIAAISKITDKAKCDAAVPDVRPTRASSRADR